MFCVLDFIYQYRVALFLSNYISVPPIKKNQNFNGTIRSTFCEGSIHSTFYEGILKELFIVRFMKDLFMIFFIVRFMKELFIVRFMRQLFIVRFMKEFQKDASQNLTNSKNDRFQSRGISLVG